MFRKIKKYFWTRDLKKRSRQISRKRRIHNFTTARTAGLIFTCKDEEEFDAVKDFKGFLESEAIETDVLGYVNDKQIPDHYLLRQGFHFFCLKDLNWYYKPVNSYAGLFMMKPYDLLFDLSMEEHAPVQYIRLLTAASYKIGRIRTGNGLDLMIDIPPHQTVAYLIEQIKHYLSIIHTSKTE